ncbi:MAG: EamA family transporter [Deltaproteobacteria bacterium]|nr:EamA family transporter [Deltaproteobacteria bacterium]
MQSTVSSQNPISSWLPYVLLMVPPLCWAGNIVLARGVIHLIPPIGFAFWRWAIAFLILAPLTWPHVRHDWPTVIGSWKIMVALSMLGVGCFNTLLYIAVHTTTAINGALIQTTMPAFIILITLIAFQESVGFLQMAGVMLCILGAALVLLRGNLATVLNLSFARGDLLMLLAVICYGMYTVLLKKRPAMHAMSFLTVTFGAGAMMLAPLYLWESCFQESVTFTVDVVLSIIYVAVFPSIVAYFCWNRGTEMIGPNRAGLFINLVPVFASIMAVIWLNESLKLFHIVGMCSIVAGMSMFNRKPNIQDLTTPGPCE